MRKLLLLLSCIILLITSVSANTSCNELIDLLNIKTGMVVPKAIPYSNEVFDVYLKDNTTIGHITIEDKIITDFSCNITTEPTFNVYIESVDIVRNITNSDNKVDAFDDALSDKTIEIKGTSVMKSMKGFFTKLSVKIASWFV